MSKPQGSIACNALKDPLMPMEIEKPILRVSNSQPDIMEDYNPFITKDLYH